MAYIYNGNPIQIDAPFTAPDGTRYPNLRDPDLRESLGVTEVADEPAYDQRFYWGVGNPKQLDDIEVTPEEGEPYTQKGLKSQWIAQVKDTAGKMLSASDWKVVRAAEGIKPCDDTTLAFRASVRAYSDLLEASISDCSNVEELIVVVTNQDWPKGE